MALRVVVLGQVPASLSTQVAAMAASMDMVVVADALDLRAARAVLGEQLPDIALVGSTFADGSGIAFLRDLAPGERPVACIVVGSRDEDAVAAFELQATDFVLWPTAPARLSEALTRARQQVLQLALLRTADELQRLLGEASAAGGIDLRGALGARVASVPAPPERGRAIRPAGRAMAARGSGAAAGEEPDPRSRRATGDAATGTLVASAPWRTAARTDVRPVRGRELSDEPVLDLSQEDGGRAGSEGRPLRVLVREGRRTRFVPLSDVDWFEADGNYIKVNAAGMTYRTRGTITAIEAALDPRQFVRIHRRMVVNMDRVRELSPLPGGDGLLVLGNGSTLRLSRTYRARVR